MRSSQFSSEVPVVVLAPGYHGHGIARSLGRLGVPVYGVHADPRSPAARSKYWRQNSFLDLDQSAPEESVASLLQMARSIGPRPILIPTDDKSCLFVADHAEALKEAFVFPDQPAGLARSLSSKESMFYLCRDYSIPTPATVFPRSYEDAETFAISAAYPVMLKGIDTLALRDRTGVKMVLVEEKDSLLREYSRLEDPNSPNLMLQEYIPGGSESVWMFNGYFDGGSRCLFGLTGQKIRQYPPHKGVTSLGVCVSNEAVVSLTTTFMQAIGYRGILDIGYKYDPRTHQYKLLDVNPRIGTTFRLFVDRNGMDVARVMYRDMTNQPVHPGAAPEGRKWMVENFDLLSSIRSWRDGQLRLGQWIESFRGVEEASWLAKDDLTPFAAMWWRSAEWALGEAFAKMPMGRFQGGGGRPLG